MGRIKTLQIKSMTKRLMELHGDEFGDDFQGNKAIVNKWILTSSKKLRNIIAGYATRIHRKSSGQSEAV